jgi:hypothetical protein
MTPMVTDEEQNKFFYRCSSVPNWCPKFFAFFSSYLGVLGALAVAFPPP